MTIELEKFHDDPSKELGHQTLEKRIRVVEEHLISATEAARIAPDDIDAVQELEATLAEAAVAIQEIAPQYPDLAEEALEPLTQAADILVHATAETPFRKAELAARVAAKVHNAGQRGRRVVELAHEQIDELFTHTHAPNDEVGIALDTNLASAYKEAITDRRKFDIALGHQVAKAYDSTEFVLDTESALASHRSNRAAEKASRKARMKGHDLEATGIAPIEEFEEVDEPSVSSPTISDPEAYKKWKKDLGLKTSFRIAHTAMRDDENERIATPEEMAKIRAELDTLHEKQDVA